MTLENGRISDFQGLVTLILDRVILHTVMQHSSTSTYIPNFIEIEETVCGRTDVWTDGRLRPTNVIRSTRSRPKKCMAIKTTHKTSSLFAGLSLLPGTAYSQNQPKTIFMKYLG